MKKRAQLLMYSLLLLILAAAFRHPSSGNNNVLDGAWEKRTDKVQEILLFADGYVTHTVYDKSGRRFISTRGGSFTTQGNKLSVQVEFDTEETDAIGQTLSYGATVSQNTLTTTFDGSEQKWIRLDAGNSGLAGLWKITSRKKEGGLVQIHQTGTRKTVKILSGSRFQWAAIDPGTKQFMGTGGGTYTFQNGRYTEHIEFFSRDSSRVGSSLSFDGKLENGDWHHSGLSSRGDPIYEVWSRKK